LITIIDIKMGNINSVVKALKFLKLDSEVIDDPSKLDSASKIIFPGVGNFSSASKVLNENGMREAIREAVLEREVPFLGICLGMQLMLTKGYEGAQSNGLDLIPGEVCSIVGIGDLPVPHMGWNNVTHNNLQLFKGLNSDDCFYFVHSFEAILDSNTKHATTDYGKNIVAAIENKHIWGTQFHPEKSQGPGLKILQNFGEV